jgi:hypothetical protein
MILNTYKVEYLDDFKPTIITAENMLQIDKIIFDKFGAERFEKISGMKRLEPEIL